MAKKAISGPRAAGNRTGRASLADRTTKSVTRVARPGDKVRGEEGGQEGR
jgi:hypothetical protein